MNVYLFKNDELLYKGNFFTKTFIHNILLEGNLIANDTGKKHPAGNTSNTPYSLICSLDLSECPLNLKVNIFIYLYIHKT